MPTDQTNTPRLRRRFGKFRLERRLGETESADTFEATDTVMGHAVALKILKPEYSGRPALKHLSATLPVVTASDHPGILRAQDASVVHGRLLLAMPLGLESLTSRMTRRVSAEAALLLTGQLLDTIAYAHERRLIHGRLHADQVILFPDLAARITDFAFANVTGPVADDFRADVAAVGRLVLQLFGASLGRSKQSFAEVLEQQPRIADRWPAVLVAWLHKATDRRRSQRFGSVAVMKQAFQEIEDQVCERFGCRGTVLATSAAPFPRVRSAA
ncbi:MAG: serine/threonine-protein kinase [Fuerstiella sp.]